MDGMQQITLLVAVVLLVGAGVIAGAGARLDRSAPRPKPSSRKQGKKPRRLRDLDVGMLCAEVATRLDSGTSVEAAWDASLARIDTRLGLLEVKDFVKNPRLRRTTNPLSELKHREATATALEGMLVATQVSQEVGAPLAQILSRVADGISASLEAAAKRHNAQVGPKATAKLLGALPLAAVAMSHLVGVDVLSMAFSGGLNSAIFAVGIGLMVAGNLWSEWMIRRASGKTTHGLEPTLAMDIVAACQQNGVSLTSTLEALAKASGEPDLAVASKMLLLGASWEEAWEQAADKWNDLASVLEPAWKEGASPVPLLVRGAAQTRAHQTHEALAAAEKLGVRLVVPLGVCLLPAFFALGIVPVVVSTIEDLVG